MRYGFVPKASVLMLALVPGCMRQPAQITQPKARLFDVPSPVSHTVVVTIWCYGEDGNPASQTTLHWGHPSFNDSRYVDKSVAYGTKYVSPPADVKDLETEMEIQTEGPDNKTGYVIDFNVDGIDHAITLKFNQPGGLPNEFKNNSPFHTVRTSPLNGTGEQSIELDTVNPANQGDIVSGTRPPVSDMPPERPIRHP